MSNSDVNGPQRNYYYLVVGLLFVLFSVTHELNGRATVLPTIATTSVDRATSTAIFYVWRIVTAENFILGVALLAMALRSELSRSRFTAQLIAAILIARWGVIVATTLAYNIEGLVDLWVDSLAIFLCVGLIALGTRRKSTV